MGRPLNGLNCCGTTPASRHRTCSGDNEKDASDLHGSQVGGEQGAHGGPLCTLDATAPALHAQQQSQQPYYELLLRPPSQPQEQCHEHLQYQGHYQLQKQPELQRELSYQPAALFGLVAQPNPKAIATDHIGPSLPSPTSSVATMALDQGTVPGSDSTACHTYVDYSHTANPASGVAPAIEYAIQQSGIASRTLDGLVAFNPTAATVVIVVFIALCLPHISNRDLFSQFGSHHFIEQMPGHPMQVIVAAAVMAVVVICRLITNVGSWRRLPLLCWWGPSAPAATSVANPKSPLVEPVLEGLDQLNFDNQQQIQLLHQRQITGLEVPLLQLQEQQPNQGALAAVPAGAAGSIVSAADISTAVAASAAGTQSSTEVMDQCGNLSILPSSITTGAEVQSHWGASSRLQQSCRPASALIDGGDCSNCSNNSIATSTNRDQRLFSWIRDLLNQCFNGGHGRSHSLQRWAAVSHAANDSRGAMPSASEPSCLPWLWRFALPGLHLLSHPKRQITRMIHKDDSETRSDYFPASRGCGGSHIDVGRALAAADGVITSPGWASEQSGPLNGQAMHRVGASPGAIGAAWRVVALASAFCCRLGAAISLSTRGTQLFPSSAGGGNETGMNSRGARAASIQMPGQNGLVTNMVSNLFPRVAGGWGMSRSASNTSLTELMEAAVGGCDGSNGRNGGGGRAATGATAMTAESFSGGDGSGSGADGGRSGGNNWDPLATNNAHLLLLSSADAATRKPAFSDLPENAGRVQVLSVDDEPVNQQVMRALLWSAEYEVLEARNGEDALEIIRNCELLPDLVLLDVTLGGAVSGFEVCLELRREYSPGELPVIMITCSSLEEDVIRGLAVGANDYLIKPLRNLELMARIKTQLALKRSIRVAAEARVNRSLLGSILPANVIRQLKQGVTLIAQFHKEVTILFSDIRGFTNLATEWPTEQIILMLNNMFTVFDRLCDQLGVYKVETIGDAYMIVSGHDGVEDHAVRMLRMATHMLAAVSEMRGYDGRPLQIRVGVHTGPAHSGVVGLSRPRYCFFGDTVNTASRMESTGFPMAVQVSESTMHAVTLRPEWASEFQFAPCGPRDIKGKGTMHTFLLRVGMYDHALAELASAATARASIARPKRRSDTPVTAADSAKDPGGEGLDAAAPSRPEEETAVIANSTPQPVKSWAPSSGSAMLGLQNMSGYWRHQVSGTAVVNGDPGNDPGDHVKFASYRYHHPGADVLSSGGTNVLLENGLTVLIPSHVLDGSLLETLDAAPSSTVHYAPAIASTGVGVSGAAAASRTKLCSSGSMHFASGPSISPSATRRLAAPVEALDSKASGSTTSPYQALAAGAVAIVPSPVASTRASSELSGRGSLAAAGGITAVGPADATSGVGQEAAFAASTLQQSKMMVKPPATQESALPTDPASVQRMPSEMSECMEEPSLHYAVDGGGGSTAVSAAARVLTDIAAVSRFSYARLQSSCLGDRAQLRRSTVRTSAELSVAANAAAAMAGNSSCNDGADTQTAVCKPEPQIDLDSLIAVQGFLDEPYAATDSIGVGIGSPDVPTIGGSMVGWSMLAEVLEPTHISRSSISTHEVAHTLGNWIQGGTGGGDKCMTPSTVAMLAMLQPKAQLASTGSSEPNANAALALEPTLAVAAEALAAAVDSALNSGTDEVVDAPSTSFCVNGGTDCKSSGPKFSSLANLRSAPPPPSAGTAPASSSQNTVRCNKAADTSPDVIATAIVSASAMAADSAAKGVRLGPARGSSSPFLAQHKPAALPPRMASNTGMVQSQTSTQRRSCERPALDLRPSGLESGVFGGGGAVGSSSLGSGSGNGAFESLNQRPEWIRSGVTSFNSSAFANLQSSHETGSKDPGTRRFLIGKRPATATGTVQCSMANNNAAQFFLRETTVPSAHNGAGSSGASAAAAAAAAGTGNGWSPVAATVQRSAQNAFASSNTGGARRRPATAHGAAAVAAGCGQGHDQGHEHATGAGSGGSAAVVTLRGPSPRAGPDEAVPVPAPTTGEDFPCRASLAMVTSLSRMDSGASLSGTTLAGLSNRGNSRKSFNCGSMPRQAGGGGAASISNANMGGGGLLTSVGSMGGVSIISQGWSNLYDPMCPRPRLTDHYYTSGDFEDFGSGGAQTPGSFLSPSIGSAHSAQPSPTMLTPAHSSTVAAAAAGGAGASVGGSGAAADMGTAVSSPAQIQSGAVWTGRSHPGPGTSIGAMVTSIGGAPRLATQHSQAGPQPADAGISRSQDRDTAAAFDPMFGEMSGVTSMHDVAYGMGGTFGCGKELEAEGEDADLLHRSLQPPSPRSQSQVQLHSQRQPTSTLQQQQQQQQQQMGISAGGKSPLGSAGWEFAPNSLEPSDAILLLNPTRHGCSQVPPYSVDAIAHGRDTSATKSVAAATTAAGLVGRSRSLDVIHPRTEIDDKTYPSLYDTVHGYTPVYGAKSPQERVLVVLAGTATCGKQEKSVTVQPAGLVVPPPSSQTTFPGYEHLQDTGRALVARSPATSPARESPHVAFHGINGRSGDYYLLNNAIVGSVAAAPAAVSLVLTSTDASSMVDLTAANGSSSSFPGLVGGFGDRISSRGPGNSFRQMSPVLSTGTLISAATNVVCNSAPYAMDAAPNANPSVPHSRRHSVDVIRRQTSTSTSPVMAGAAGGATTGSAYAFNRWHQTANGTQPSGTTRDSLPARVSEDLPRRIWPGGFGSPIGALGLASATSGTASEAAQSTVGGMSASGTGGVDIGRMLARASELVAVTGICTRSGDTLAGAGDCDAAQPPSPSHPSASVIARHQLLGNESQQPSSPDPCLYEGTFSCAGAGAGTGTGDGAVAMVPSGAPSPGEANIRAQDPAGATGTAGVTYMVSTSDYHQPYHHPHHLQAMPYGISQPVHVTRLDPVEEGGGSSAALSMGASSASVAAGSVQNIFASPAAFAATGSTAATADTPALLAPSDSPSVPAASIGGSRHSADQRQLSLISGNKSQMAAAAAAAAAAGVSLSNSGAGYRRCPSMSSTSASSRASLPATPQHPRGADGVPEPWVVADPTLLMDAVTRDKQVLRKPKSIKRSLSIIMRKVKSVLRPGGGGGVDGGEGRGGQ